MRRMTKLSLLALYGNSIAVHALPFFWGGPTTVSQPPRQVPNKPEAPPVPLRPSSPAPAIPLISGKMTYYGTDSDPAPTQYYGACGFEPATVGENFVAVNSVQYQADKCGACIAISYRGKCVEGVVVDKCPTCGGYGGIDVALDIFATLVGSKTEAIRLGTIPDVNWKYTTCGLGCVE